VSRSLQLSNKGGHLVLGSTPIPRTNGSQSEDTSAIYHQPPIKPNGGQEMEGGGYRKHKTGTRSGKFIGGEGETVK
jgi:hypothetical protein